MEWNDYTPAAGPENEVHDGGPDMGAGQNVEGEELPKQFDSRRDLLPKIRTTFRLLVHFLTRFQQLVIQSPAQFQRFF